MPGDAAVMMSFILASLAHHAGAAFRAGDVLTGLTRLVADLVPTAWTYAVAFGTGSGLVPTTLSLSTSSTAAGAVSTSIASSKS